MKIFLDQLLLKLRSKPQLLSTIFFISILLIGLFVFNDYGISWDEDRSRLNAVVTLKYLRGDDLLLNYEDRSYGVGFEMLLLLAEGMFRSTGNWILVYQNRHLLTFIFFFLALLCFYKVLKLRFGHAWTALLGSGFLLFSPRIFAESFYNSKDIPLLSALLIAWYFLYRFLANHKTKDLLLLIAFSAFSISIRVVALLPVLIFAGGLSIPLITGRITYAKVKTPLLYLLGTAIGSYLLWPYLWTDPLGRFIESFSVMSRFPWDRTILFWGSRIPVSDIPWFYIPVWILISTPPLYVALAILGLFVVIKGIRVRWDEPRQVMDMLAAVLFFSPVAAVILLGSKVYDGWRHLYFIYPYLIYLATLGWSWVFKKGKKVRAVLIGLTAVSLVSVLMWMLCWHPYQYTYFNFIQNAIIKKDFEADYC
jgi:hypothetical protein